MRRRPRMQKANLPKSEFLITGTNIVRLAGLSDCKTLQTDFAFRFAVFSQRDARGDGRQG